MFTSVATMDSSKKASGIDFALERILSFIDDPHDRCSISLICKKWLAMENYTRREVTVAFCYTTTPSRLTERFKFLQSLKVKGKPRADMYNLMPGNWGAYAEPWVQEVVLKCPRLSSLHFRRMVVSDEDLLKLAQARGNRLRELKLDRCSGFSTIGLEVIAQHCRQLRVLFLDESAIENYSGKWLHEIALHNSSLEVLNFYATNLTVDVADLDTIATNCKSLSSLKVYDIELSSLRGVLNRATSLKELVGVSVTGDVDLYDGKINGSFGLPRGLTSVGLMYTGGDTSDASVIPLICPLASGLKKLDLQLTGLSLEGHSAEWSWDEGLEIVAANCKNLRRLCVESGDREFQQGYVTQRGLIAIAQGCQKLEYISLYVSDINNAAFEALGKGCPTLRDFCLVLLMDEIPNPDFPLDYGVYALLDRCHDLMHLALYLRQGALSNTGMMYIGKLGKKLRWVLLGLLGESDEGFSWLADGCPKLERLEMRDCVFSEAGLAKSVLKMKALKYVWVQGYNATAQGDDLLVMSIKPFWNIEFIPEQRNTRRDNEEFIPEQRNTRRDNEDEAWNVWTRPAQFLAYHSLAGRRRDCPGIVLQLA